MGKDGGSEKNTTKTIAKMGGRERKVLKPIRLA